MRQQNHHRPIRGRRRSRRGRAATSGLPGFVAGYWLARSADQGLAVIVFDSEEAAQSLADFLKTVPDAPVVTLDRDSIVVAEVLAHA